MENGENYIKDALRKTSKIPEDQIPQIEMVTSEKIYNYRNRTNFKRDTEEKKIGGVTAHV